MTDHQGDGVALHSTRHPPNITEEMIAVGHEALLKTSAPKGTWDREVIKAIYTAMSDAAPPEPDIEISEDALETVEREFEIDRWQDIATAPRDGTEVLLFYPHLHDDGFVTAGYWYRGGLDDVSHWYSDLVNGGASPPTQWQPLPSSPKQKLSVLNNGENECP